jgi:hypothetical protein
MKRYKTATGNDGRIVIADLNTGFTALVDEKEFADNIVHALTCFPEMKAALERAAQDLAGHHAVSLAMAHPQLPPPPEPESMKMVNAALRMACGIQENAITPTPSYPVITFQGGGLYTKHGQRIAAMHDTDKGLIYMVDVDRGLYYVYKSMDVSFNKWAIRHAYLHNQNDNSKNVPPDVIRMLEEKAREVPDA